MNIKYVTLETNILLHVKPESNKYTVGGEKNRFFQNAWIFVSGWVWLEFKEKNRYQCKIWQNYPWTWWWKLNSIKEHW